MVTLLTGRVLAETLDAMPTGKLQEIDISYMELIRQGGYCTQLCPFLSLYLHCLLWVDRYTEQT